MSTCYGPECNREAVACGLCNAHWYQQRKGGPLRPIRPQIDGAALVEDALFLRDMGEHPERAAQRLGVAPAALEKALRRKGHTWPELTSLIGQQHRQRSAA